MLVSPRALTYAAKAGCPALELPHCMIFCDDDFLNSQGTCHMKVWPLVMVGLGHVGFSQNCDLYSNKRLKQDTREPYCIRFCNDDFVMSQSTCHTKMKPLVMVGLGCLCFSDCFCDLYSNKRLQQDNREPLLHQVL